MGVAINQSGGAILSTTKTGFVWNIPTAGSPNFDSGNIFRVTGGKVLIYEIVCRNTALTTLSTAAIVCGVSLNDGTNYVYGGTTSLAFQTANLRQGFILATTITGAFAGGLVTANATIANPAASGSVALSPLTLGNGAILYPSSGGTDYISFFATGTSTTNANNLTFDITCFWRPIDSTAVLTAV